MAFTDLREFLSAIEAAGELAAIEQEVDWDLEVGAISRRAYELGGPAVWFKKIKDYPPGFSILNGSLGTWRRVAVAMGLPPDTPVREIYAEYDRRLEKRIPPVVVSRDEAPCKENVRVGDEVDLYELPAPMIHDGDGGRYLCTWDIVVTRENKTGWTNWGMYRFMIHNRNVLGGNPQGVSHLGMQMKAEYLPANARMPVAIVLGGDPLCQMAASAPARPGEDEADLAGGLRQEPVRLVKCETSDLLVPADAEIVIEGEILPDRIVPEGPFGEYPGYKSGSMNMWGVAVEVKAITFRNSPILTMIALGMPCDDSSIAASLSAAGAMKSGLRRRGLPVTDLYVPPEGVTHLVVVAVERGGYEVTKRVLEYFTARRAMVSKVIVVDSDVDVFNMNEVWHALATKCHPGRGIIIERYEGKANVVTPYYTTEERRTLSGASVAFDCTWPPEWPPEATPIKSAFNTIYPEEVRQKVLQNWTLYGLKP